MADRPVVNTIGFTKKSAEVFFSRLIGSGVRLVIDVRLHNTSQLSGFAKSADLAYFLRKIGNIKYEHMSMLAPDEYMLNQYKKGGWLWPEYERNFLKLMELRKIEEKLDPSLLAESCLLCSEDKPHHCHRRLVCDYLNMKWDNKLYVQHL